MTRKTLVLSVASAVLFFAALPAEPNQIVLPGAVQVSGIGRDHDPAAAFNSVDHTWLVVWREVHASIAGAMNIVGRIVREDRSFAGPAFFIDGSGFGAIPPRVAHDPIRNEWIVAYGLQASIVDDVPHFIYGRKVASNGTLTGASREISQAGRIGELWPDVAAASRKSTITPTPPTPYFVVVWEEDVGGRPGIVGRTITDDPAQASRIGFSGAQYSIDTHASLPANRRSTRPRMTQRAPTIGTFPPTTVETSHRVVYEVESAGHKDIS